MTMKTYRQNGCNRGGVDHALQLINKLPESAAPSVAVELVDREQGRAAALAPVFEARGLPVRVTEATAPLRSAATVDVYAVDDVDVLARVLDGSIRSSLLEMALLVAVPTIESVGGVVVAIAATVTPDATAVQDAARMILRRIAALVPGRRSSALMAAHGIHAAQMPGARHVAHDRLTTHSTTFLTTGQVESELMLVDGFTRTPYRLRLVETRQEMRRRMLKEAALQEILPQFADQGDNQGVVFYERQDPWLYVVLARRRASRWCLDRTIELPVRMLATQPEPVEVPTWITD